MNSVEMRLLYVMCTTPLTDCAILLNSAKVTVSRGFGAFKCEVLLQDEFNLAGVRPDEMHITEEWFHGKINRDNAVILLKENKDLGNGLFLVRESNTFVGDFSLSFL